MDVTAHVLIAFVLQVQQMSMQSRPLWRNPSAVVPDLQDAAHLARQPSQVTERPVSMHEHDLYAPHGACSHGDLCWLTVH